MDKQCSGKFGKWFGHNFQSFKVKSGIERPFGEWCTIHGRDEIQNYLDRERDEFVVACTRCGVKLDDNRHL